MASDRNSVIHGNQIKDRTVTKAELDATSESAGKVATVQANGSVDWEFIQSLQDYTKLQDNIMLNAFRIAINGSLTQFNMIDGIVDEYEDESGIDTVNSLNEVYNSTDDYYSPFAPSLDTSPFSHMKMQDKTDVGTGANAVTNVGTPTYTSGKIINALTLDGSTDALNVNALRADIDADTVGSIAFWLKTSSTSAVVLGFGDGAGGNFAEVQVLGAGVIRFWVYTSSAYVIDYRSSINISDNTWHHIVFTQNGSQLRIYVDGSEDTSPTKTDDTKAGAWFADATLSNGYIGVRHDGTLNTFFAGQIDDFRYYQNKALTADEVSAIYNGGDGTEDDQPTGVPENMTLISDSFTAEAVPDTARIVLLEEDDDVITLNTDLKAYATRDAGVSWVEGTLTDEGDYDASKRILVANFDLTQSGIGSGTSMEYKLVTANNKGLAIHASSLNWD